MRRIDDSGSWAGKMKGQFDSGTKNISEDSLYGAGMAKNYPDTAEAIKKNQGTNIKRVMKNSIKNENRN